MPNKIPKEKRKNFDLLERTAKFGENTIEFAQILPRNEINRSLVSQIFRSATSIGANYMEADGAVSKKDFENKIGISRKESKESMHWFRMIAKANSNESEKCRKLWKEAQELVWIFSSIISNSRNKKDK
ncbi:MAG: four helix bundle protein [Candidatus Moranbacteria bacterium CG_4_9_14_3_um_filter_40_7]|nr:MAG: four helix bundle protein [Candidatus Moranbacteria bacterium CG_4_9_14_3_um_filter_40_7]